VIAATAQDTPQDKVRVLQRKLYRAAKEAPHRRFGVLSAKGYRRDVLAEAWQRVRRTRGSAGVDQQTIAEVEAYGADRLLNELEVELREKRSRPRPVRRVYIPKPGTPGQRRGLGMPAVRDRIVHAAVKLVIEPILEADFRACAYGFRPKRGAHEAICEMQAQVTWGYRQVIDADLKACFDSLPHDGGSPPWRGASATRGCCA
jgi:RNA-directed DNA polymerase